MDLLSWRSGLVSKNWTGTESRLEGIRNGMKDGQVPHCSNLYTEAIVDSRPGPQIQSNCQGRIGPQSPYRGRDQF